MKRLLVNMGKVYETFKNMKNKNEADVNQNFVVVLLSKFLGYKKSDIKPERIFPAKDNYYGKRKFNSKELPKEQRPDYVVCIDDIENPRFVVESKNPNENLEKHLSQIKSYAIGVGVNLLVITNGKAFRIYDVNEILFEVKDLENLDIHFDKVLSLLSRETHEQTNLLDIILSADISKNLLSIKQEGDVKKKIKLKISDYKHYLKAISKEFSNWYAPEDLGNRMSEIIEPYPPDELHSFSYFLEENELSSIPPILSFKEIESKFFSNPLIFVGESGIGKTSLLKYLTRQRAQDCLDLQDTPTPIYVQLRYYGPNRDIQKLMFNFLQKRGYKGEDSDFAKDIINKRFIFFFDGFDEIQEGSVNYAKQELKELIENSNNHFIITTRKFRPLSLPSAIMFSVRPLNNEKIEMISEKYLDSNKYNFLSNIYFHGLEKEASNTLLLTLMLILFKTKGDLPNTTMGIIESILKWIREWEEQKGSRFDRPISWDIKIMLLSNIAFEIIKKEDELYLDIRRDSYLVQYISELKQTHVLPNNLDTNQIILELESTGLILRNETEISFWHRAFLDYFAGVAIAEKAKQKSISIEDLIDNIEKVTWNRPLKAACRELENPNDLIRGIYEKSELSAAGCICENDNVNEVIVNQTIEWLKNKTNSSIHSVRLRALDLLRRIGIINPHNIFQELIDSKYSDVKMFSLKEFAKTKSITAKEIVYENIDWDEGGFYIGSTQGAIARCLVNFDEEANLKIIEIWKKKMDMFTNIDCTDALIEVVRSGKSTDLLKQKLIEFYLDEIHPKGTGINKARHIGKILAEINDLSILPEILEKIDSEKIRYNFDLEDLMAGFKSKKAIEYLLELITNPNTTEYIKNISSSAIAKSKANVDLDVYINFLENKNPKIRKAGVEGLKRFSSNQIKHHLLKAVNDTDAWVQNTAIEVLAQKGLLSLLANKSTFPKDLYVNSFETLLIEIARGQVKEFSHYLNHIKDKVKDNRRRIKVINACLGIGEITKAKEMVDEFYDGQELKLREFELLDLIEIALYFDEKYGLKIIRDAISILDKDEESRGLWYENCIESLEKINTDNALNELISLAETFANEKDVINIERSLRALVRISPKDKEDWLIEFYNKHPELKGADLNRVLELLGAIGSLKSIPLIEKIAQEHKSDEYILDACLWAIENIYASNGIIKYIDENDLFS